MSTRVPRHVAKELIQYLKKVDVTANFWDPRAKSAFEFSRQMSSPKLKKLNTTFASNITVQTDDTKIEQPVVEVEFLDGGKMTISSFDKTCADLRSVVFDRAAEAEENVEAKGGGKADASKGASGAGAGKAADAKKGGKK